ncbi:MAG TPA: hypothetical protein V6C99_10335 [Oculatellaceae cyanobacterium]|jgi:hypothetical protein
MQIPKPSARQPSLKERANWFSNLIREPGWELLKRTFKPEIRSRITDSDAKEAFLYEAIRAQVIQEIFSTPHWVITQAEREWGRATPVDETTEDTEHNTSKEV